MMEGHSGHKRIAPNPDVLGMAVASLCATIVMAVGFWRGMDGFTIALRVGIVFVIAYAAAFLLVRCVVRIVVAEMVERDRQRREEEQAQRAAAAEESSETGRQAT
jgi:hypothetical protein